MKRASRVEYQCSVVSVLLTPELATWLESQFQPNWHLQHNLQLARSRLTTKPVTPPVVFLLPSPLALMTTPWSSIVYMQRSYSGQRFECCRGVLESCWRRRGWSHVREGSCVDCLWFVSFGTRLDAGLVHSISRRHPSHW